MMTDKQTIVPCLWFTNEAEEAVNFYISLFSNSSIDHKVSSAVDWPGGKAGDVIVIDFVLAGQRYQALNGGPNENAGFNDSISLSVTCEDQVEVDRCWDALTANGGEPIMCGWLRDRYGLRWQIVPRALIDMLRESDPVRSKRVMEAMMQMVKLDVAGLKEAYEAG